MSSEANSIHHGATGSVHDLLPCGSCPLDGKLSSSPGLLLGIPLISQGCAALATQVPLVALLILSLLTYSVISGSLRLFETQALACRPAAARLVDFGGVSVASHVGLLAGVVFDCLC